MECGCGGYLPRYYHRWGGMPSCLPSIRKKKQCCLFRVLTLWRPMQEIIAALSTLLFFLSKISDLQTVSKSFLLSDNL